MVVLVVIDELVGSRDRPVAVDGGGVAVGVFMGRYVSVIGQNQNQTNVIGF